MRLNRLVPRASVDLEEILLRDLEAIETGLTLVASSVPLPRLGRIHALATDGRGRLVLLRFARRAGARTILRALAQWEWIASGREFLNAVARLEEIDLVTPPRVLVVAAVLPRSSRRLVARIRDPRIEMFRATLVSDGTRRGVLVDAMASRASAARRSEAPDPGPAARAADRPASREEAPVTRGAHPAPAPAIVTPTPAPAARPAGAAGTAGTTGTMTLDPVKLTPEEIAEFRRLATAPDRPADPDDAPRSPAESAHDGARGRFMEN